MEPSTAEKQRLCQLAIEASLILDRQLNQLLDAYDLYTRLTPPQTEAELFELTDLQASLKALGSLPIELATWLTDLRNDWPRMTSAAGFQEHVIDEFALHMHSFAVFLLRKGMDLSEFDPALFGKVMNDLRMVNGKLT